MSGKIIPFWHEELEVKKKFLEIARDCTKKGTGEDNSAIAHELAGGLLYANLAEYLAGHLLKSLNQTAKDAVKTYFHGAISIKLPDLETRPLNDVIKQLKHYDFPSKEVIIELLEKIKDARNKLSHQILKVPASKLHEIDEAVNEITTNTEELVNEIDTIYRGLPPKNIMSND